MSKRCKHQFTRLTMKDGTTRQGLSIAVELARPTDGCQAADLLSAKCDDCGEQLGLGESDEAPVAVEIEIRAAEIGDGEDSGATLGEVNGWDIHMCVDDVLYSDDAATGWLAREMATHDDREARDADAWPWDVTRALTGQFEEHDQLLIDRILGGPEDDTPPADPALQAAAARYLASDEGKGFADAHDSESCPCRACVRKQLVEEQARNDPAPTCFDFDYSDKEAT